MKHVLYIWILCVMVLMCSSCTSECTEESTTKACSSGSDFVIVGDIQSRSFYYGTVVEEPITHTRYIMSKYGGVCPIYNPDGTIHKF